MHNYLFSLFGFLWQGKITAMSRNLNKHFKFLALTLFFNVFSNIIIKISSSSFSTALLSLKALKRKVNRGLRV